MVLLLISLLKDRRPGEPVPVWITLGSWNPNKQNLRDYAATVIGRDYPFTREQAFGGERGPKALLDAQQVALFLDGLDEMPAGLRAVATQEIDEERTLPIVMTSRVDEDASATDEKWPYGAVIQMVALKVDETITALKSGHKADRVAVWKRFTDRLVRESSESTLWTSPLSVSLLRQTYETSGDDPCELFDREKYPNDDAIQANLIERVLDQAYPDPKQRESVTYWLTWIAYKLDDTRDIRWWFIPSWDRRLSLTLGVVFGLVVGLGCGIYMGLELGPRVGLVLGMLFGLPYIIFRPHNVYGDRQNIGDPYRNVIGIFMNQILRGEPLTVFGDGEQSRAFTFIEDVSVPIARSVAIPAAYQQTFNIGGDRPYTVNQLIESVAGAMGVRPEVTYLPPRNEVLHVYADHQLVRSLFGDLGRNVPLNEGLARMAAWVRQHGPQEPLTFEGIEVTRNMPPSWQALVRV